VYVQFLGAKLWKSGLNRCVKIHRCTPIRLTVTSCERDREKAKERERVCVRVFVSVFFCEELL